MEERWASSVWDWRVLFCSLYQFGVRFSENARSQERRAGTVKGDRETVEGCGRVCEPLHGLYPNTSEILVPGPLPGTHLANEYQSFLGSPQHQPFGESVF